MKLVIHLLLMLRLRMLKIHYVIPKNALHVRIIYIFTYIRSKLLHLMIFLRTFSGTFFINEAYIKKYI